MKLTKKTERRQKNKTKNKFLVSQLDVFCRYIY